eukprot:TRINITY_DN8809_c1_g1_i2.p1 TRINITY_DN8809_c1_g1~~TRINITY_DN8809_c1_g1_i2.p1  ORF type:complete len:199 (+),score=21.10 TRINITY_DN8809_c1_g1_i2:64-597(+)
MDFSVKNGVARAVKKDLETLLDSSPALRNLLVCIEPPLVSMKVVNEWERDVEWLLNLLFSWKSEDDKGKEATIVCGGTMAASTEIHESQGKSFIRCLCAGAMTSSPVNFDLCPEDDFIKGYKLRHEYETWEGERSFVTLGLTVTPSRGAAAAVEFHTAPCVKTPTPRTRRSTVTRSY